MNQDFTLPGGRLVAPATYTRTGSARVAVRNGLNEFDILRDVDGVRGAGWPVSSAFRVRLVLPVEAPVIEG